MRLDRPPLALPLATLALALSLAPPARSDAPLPPPRWTDVTPDAMVDDALARAAAPKAPEADQLAALATLLALADRAEDGRAQKAFERTAATATIGAEVRGEASLLARMISSDEGTEAGQRADRALGVVDAVSLLGPFRDTGGGLDAKDGPEGPPPRADAPITFDPGARYSWGSYEVAWREVPRAFAAARGVPLDVFVFPRKESCTWVATRLAVGKKQSLVLRAAATGQLRLVVDGATVARDEAVHEAARFDRLAVRVDFDAGEHLVAAKVCTGALDDEGRVRLRVTDDAGAWPDGVTASALPKPPARHAASHGATTPLARAVDHAGADAAARFDAAVLRTLGGADDLRSPRAPGLLAAIADAPDADADHLAMAAWIAPSGANRSAWLGLAAARAGSDAATKAFVARRQVERHLEAQLGDWAIASLRATKLDEARDAEAAYIAAQVEMSLAIEAERLRAMRRLAAVADASPNAPEAVLDLLARVAAGLDPGRAFAVRTRMAARGDHGSDEVREVTRARGRDAGIAAAKLAFAGHVEDADEALAIAQQVAAAGAHGEARSLYEQLGRWAPNRAGVWAGLAEEIGASPGDATRDAGIAAALRRARELEPGEARYRAELALRAKSAGSDSEKHDDDKYLLPSATILARRQASTPAPVTVAPTEGAANQPGAKAAPPPSPAEPPDVSQRQLHWLRAVTMHPDRRVSELVHYANEIVIPPRTEEELYEDVPAEGDITEIVRARVHRKDGGTAFPVEEANEGAHPRIRWPELASGDVVEVAFRSYTEAPVGGRGDSPFTRIDYAGSTTTRPLVYNEVIVDSPKDHPIYVDVVNGKAEEDTTDDSGGHIVRRLVWRHPGNVPDEPLAPMQTEIVPTVVMSTFKDWNDFRAWYSEAVRGFTEPDAQVRELAAKLTKGKVTRDDKLRAIFDFVADDIRYVNFVSGEWWLPNRPQQLLARREGDCDDKAILLITLLRSVGIDAQEVMVQTRMTAEPSLLRARGAAMPIFDHGIAFLPGPGGGTYLDATSPGSRLGPLPSMDARAVALRMDGPPEVVQLPSSSPDDHGVDATWTIALAEDGSADLEGAEHATGDDAFWMRTALTEEAPRAQWVESFLVGRWFPTVEVDKKVDFKGDVGRGAAEVKWRARSDGLARHEGAELVVPLSPAQPMAASLAPLVKRTLPVWLPPNVAPRKEARTIRVVAPKGWTFESIPAGGDENGGAFGRAHLEIARDPKDARAILVKRVVVFDQSIVSVDEYAKWRAWVQRVDSLMHKSVRLAQSGGAK